MEAPLYVELMACSTKLGFSERIMFSSNNTPVDELVYAKWGNLDAYEDIAFLKSVTSIPKAISCHMILVEFWAGNRRKKPSLELTGNWSKRFIELKSTGVEEFIHALLYSETTLD